LLLSSFSDLPSGISAPDPPSEQSLLGGGQRYWRLYTCPFHPPQQNPIWFRACRIGYADSADILLRH
jgi:hypothetical protein